MKKRIGNDIQFTWHIYRKSGDTQTPESFDGKEVEVKLMSPFQQPVTIEDVSIATGVVTFTFRGKHQVTLGNYVAILQENKGEDGMVTLDVVSAVTLVAHSYMEEDGDDGDVIEAESVELTSTISAGGGTPIDAYTKAETDDLLAKKANSEYTDEHKGMLRSNETTEFYNFDNLWRAYLGSWGLTLSRGANYGTIIYDGKLKVNDEAVAMASDLAGKQDTISDLDAIRSGAAAGATAYQKPGTGIPKTDLASDVQVSLGKADTALQTETDPTVPAWAKAQNKPTYTAQEVGALPDSTTIPSALSNLTDDTTHRTVTDTEKTAWNNKVSTAELNYYVSEATFVTGKKISIAGGIVDSNNSFISVNIPCANNNTITWVYNSDQSIALYLEVFDANGQKIGAPYSSANGANGSRTFKITSKPDAAYLVATFADNTSYTPSVYVNNALVWSKVGVVNARINQVQVAATELQGNPLPQMLVNTLYFIGKMTTYAYCDKVLKLIPGKEYSLRTPMQWDHTNVSISSSYYGLTIESYDANDVKTIIVGKSTTQTSVGIDAVIDFLVPSNSAYIKIGGRANLDVKVWFAVYAKDNTITNAGKDVLNDNTCHANMRTVEVIAHRGYHSNNIPENSLDAYRMAGYMGYDMAETDFCPTSDGKLVLMHDASINRTMRNASDYSAITETVNVIDKTLAELRSDYVLISSDVRYRRPIPTLEEYFKVCKESGVFPLPEIKTSGITNQDIDNAFEMGCRIVGEGKFGFCSFSYSFLDYARTLSDKIPLYYIGTSIVDTVSSVDGTSRNMPLNVWYPQITSAITEQNIEDCHAKGIRVVFWGVTPSNYNDAIQVGIDGVCGDVIAPSIEGMFMFGIRGHKNYNILTNTGSYTNNKFLLDTDEYVSYQHNKSLPIGCHYLSIICQGDFSITGTGGLSCAISHSDMSRCLIRGLCNSATPQFRITSNADGGVIEFVEYYIQQF